jgi:flagellar motor component MotA
MKINIKNFISPKDTLKEGTHHLLLAWLIFTGIFVFAVTLAWQENALLLLYTSDKSYISYAVTIMYIFVATHCALRVAYISKQINDSKVVEALVRDSSEIQLHMEGDKVYINGNTVLPDCIVTSYIHDLLNKGTHHANTDEQIVDSNTDLIEVYESKLKRPHEIGWFSADIMIKLGLLGTIIGFIFMLASVANITDFDVTSMQKILKHMSIGMGTALYTTLAGLVCSMLAASQYYMLDNSVDKLMEATRHLAQVYILPKIN